MLNQKPLIGGGAGGQGVLQQQQKLSAKSGREIIIQDTIRKWESPPPKPRRDKM